MIQLLEGRPLTAFLQNPFVVLLGTGIAVWALLRLSFARRVVIECSPLGRRLLWTLTTVAFLANWAYVIAIDGPWTRTPDVAAEQNVETRAAHE